MSFANAQSASGQQCADFILDLRLTGSQAAEVPNDFRPATIQQGYEAQRFLVDQLGAAHNAKTAGYKVGATSSFTQQLLNVDEPFYGELLTSHLCSNGSEIASTNFRARVVEPEIGVRIGQDLPKTDTPYTAESVRPFIDAIFPTLEIVDPSFNDFGSVGAPSLIADNAVSGVFVIGELVESWGEISPAEIEVKLYLNDKLIEEGLGSNALGDPLGVVAWLANFLQAQGQTLCAGELISTGTTTDVYVAEAGDSLRAEFSSLGAVEVGFV